MSIATSVQQLPQDLRLPFLEFAETLEQDLRDKLAVRREDISVLQAVVVDLARGQERAEKRQDRLETAMVELAEAQRRTEQRVEELTEAQRRTEQRVEELAQAQRRTEQRVAELAEAQRRTEQRVEELAEAQHRTEERVDRLEIAMAGLAEAQRRTEERLDRLEAVVAALAEAQRRTEETLNKLIVRVDRIEVRLAGLVGDNLERKYREKAFSYLGQILRPVHSIPLQELLPQLETRLTEAEVDELLPLDLLLRGRARKIENQPEVWLAMEVSAVVDRGDVERAVNRAHLLFKAGFPTAPAVAGEEITEGAAQLALEQKVLLMQDGKRFNWQEALTAALESPIS
jgi:chromosome segregation ATPase